MVRVCVYASVGEQQHLFTCKINEYMETCVCRCVYRHRVKIAKDQVIL